MENQTELLQRANTLSDRLAKKDWDMHVKIEGWKGTQRMVISKKEYKLFVAGLKKFYTLTRYRDSPGFSPMNSVVQVKESSFPHLEKLVKSMGLRTGWKKKVKDSPVAVILSIQPYPG